MALRLQFPIALSLVVLACGPVSRAMPRTGADLPPPNETPYAFDEIARGRIVFDNACVRCHGLDAPAARAPAMRDVARRYRLEFADEATAVERIAAWIGAPSKDRQVLADSAVEHWGMMERVALDRDLARDVGHYIWWLGGAAADTSVTAR
jgi:mono/diheme cytochrome c family protein